MTSQRISLTIRSAVVWSTVILSLNPASPVKTAEVTAGNHGTKVSTRPSPAALPELQHDLSRAPTVLRQRLRGRWLVLSYTLGGKPGSGNHDAKIVIDYKPPSILKYRLCYRYLLKIVLRNHHWRLKSVWQKSYSRDRPPPLQTYDYREWQRLDPSRSEFHWLASCFD
jgi:hypothetical protein